MSEPVTYEDLENTEGGRFMQGDRLVARLTNRTRVPKKGADGPVWLWEPLPREQWTLHFASGHHHLPVLEAVVAALPAA